MPSLPVSEKDTLITIADISIESLLTLTYITPIRWSPHLQTSKVTYEVLNQAGGIYYWAVSGAEIGSMCSSTRQTPVPIVFASPVQIDREIEKQCYNYCSGIKFSNWGFNLPPLPWIGRVLTGRKVYTQIIWIHTGEYGKCADSFLLWLNTQSDLYNMPQSHIHTNTFFYLTITQTHTLMGHWRAQGCKDTLTCRLGKPGIKTPSMQLVDDLFYLLVYFISCCINKNLNIKHVVSSKRKSL